MAKEVKNIHEGHRKRLYDLAINAGLENMSEIQVIELFLTYILPRCDVNPLAHALLDEFETLHRIVETHYLELCRVKGINETTAKKINLFGELFFYYIGSRMGKKEVITSTVDMLDILEEQLRFRPVEHMLLLGLSPGNIVIAKRILNVGSSKKVSIPILELTRFLSASKPASFLIAHCHPYGKATPSPADKEGFEMVDRLCKDCGINFVGSFIVGDDGVYSHKDDRLLREYHDIDRVTERLNTILGLS